MNTSPVARTTLDSGPDPRLAAADVERIASIVDYVRLHSGPAILRAALPPGVPDCVVDMFSRHCRFDHGALLVFPARPADLLNRLPALGLRVDEVVPSTVVRDRVARRLGEPADSVEVLIARCAVPMDEGPARSLELFVLPTGESTRFDRIAAAERGDNSETHFAFEVVDPDRGTLLDLRDLLASQDGTVGDGGGYNPHNDTSVLYFRSRGGSARDRWPRRLEVMARGPQSDAVRRHLVEAGATAPRPTPGPTSGPTHVDPMRDMLELMTGAWVTQAIGVAARLGLADRLDERPLRAAELAEAVGAHPDRLGRLLRMLAGHDVLRVDADGAYGLTARGALLRTTVDGSLNALATIYSGLFFESYLGLEHAVRTGEDAFGHVHGEDSFDYFAARPEVARLFERAMAFGAVVFDAVPGVLDVAPEATVVDIGGGSGELLTRLLRTVPGARGVLFERAHVVAAAGESLTAAGCADRCDVVAGDFFVDPLPSGGDLYLLSRVLHDWEDVECATILRRLAEVVPADATLAIVERPVVEAGGSALPLRYDIQMMTNARGRERSVEEYRALLAEAGFELSDVRSLPLDMAVLTARPRGTDRTHARP